MHSYDGIPLAEYRLPVLCVVFSVLFIALLAVTLLLACQLWNGVDKKKKRKKDRRRRKRRSDRFFYAAIFALAIGAETCCLIFGILRPARDYALKDYAVYTGELTVHQTTRQTVIRLGDGTTVRGGAGLTEEDACGTVVYAKRSKIVLGGQK